MIGSLTSCWVMLGGSTGGRLPKGVLVLVVLAGLLSVYSEKPPWGFDWTSELPAAKIGLFALPTGPVTGLSSIGVLLNDGKLEKAGLPPLIGWAPGSVTGGPEKGTATPWASSEFPCGMFAMRATSCPAGGGSSTGSMVGG